MLFCLIVIVVAVANLGMGYAVAHHLGFAGTSAPRYYVEPTAEDAATNNAPSNVDP